MLKEIDDILKHKFYVADCDLVRFSVDRSNAEPKLSAKGYAVLVSGDIELEFNWLAQGSAARESDFTFVVTLDEAEPELNLIGITRFSESIVSDLCKKILASYNWQAEIAECLPKNEAELTSL